MIDNFYRAFEEKYRGSRALIKSRLEIYLPFIKKIKDLDAKPNAIDLGCGRGEWLELLGEYKYEAYGVELDEGMLKACHNKGLNAVHKDAFEALKELDNNSCSIISGFHIIEHIPFDTLQLLTQEALRVLKPGGLLILETPNSENIQVATDNFYLDPTHIRPIPSQLLSFLTEHYGFWRTKILRLQESKELYGATEQVTLWQVISGASPDYAIIAQKKPNNETMSNFEELFDKEYGLSLETLTSRFENRLSIIENQSLEAKAQSLEAWQQYTKIVNSNSWKITKPLRFTAKTARWLMQDATTWLKLFLTGRLKKILLNLKQNIAKHPKLKVKIAHTLNYFPFLQTKLKKLMDTNYHTEAEYVYGPQELSLKSKKVYKKLQNAINQKLQKVQSCE